MSQRENKVESYLQERMEAVGGAAEKHVNPGYRGDPDRLLSFPDRYQCMVETKWAEDVEPKAHQTRRHNWWRCRGMDVFVLRSKEEVDVFMIRMRRRWDRNYIATNIRIREERD
jgi:hypothetical protein